MLSRFRRLLIGKPLKSSALKGEKLGILWGLPILSSDAISSVAYAGQEMLIVLLPAIGVLAFGQMTILSVCIIGLLFLLVASYRQTIDCYPTGGGAFIVAKENLGPMAGMVAGAALAVDYILTVAVSISSGVEQVTSAFAFLKPYTVPFAIALVVLLMVGNLRGIRESSKLFGIPAYAFIFGMFALVIFGTIKLAGGYQPPAPDLDPAAPLKTITVLLMLKAFASGCTALTGVEAVSNAVPNFKDPSTKHAKTVLLLLAIIILLLFGGTSVLATQYQVVPGGNGAMLILMAKEIFGQGFMYYYITATTFIILVLAANTAYAGFPMLIAVMSKERFAPKQLSHRGDKLSFDNGIIVLSAISILLIAAFRANVSHLIGLYAVGVFISFTLSQSGMFVRWRRTKEANWKWKAAINGFGAVITGIVVLIIAVAKFTEGSWIVVVLIPILVFLINKVYIHYLAAQAQLKINEDEFAKFDFSKKSYVNKIIVPIEHINRSSVRALRYANMICDNVTAFHVAMDEEGAKALQRDFAKLNTTIPLVVKFSPYRKVVDPLLRFISSAEYDYKEGDMITVLMPDIEPRRRWQNILHSRTRLYVERKLLKHKHIVVSAMPLQLRDDKAFLKSVNPGKGHPKGSKHKGH